MLNDLYFIFSTNRSVLRNFRCDGFEKSGARENRQLRCCSSIAEKGMPSVPGPPSGGGGAVRDIGYAERVGDGNPISHLTKLNMGWPNFYKDNTPTAFQQRPGQLAGFGDMLAW